MKTKIRNRRKNCLSPLNVHFQWNAIESNTNVYALYALTIFRHQGDRERQWDRERKRDNRVDCYQDLIGQTKTMPSILGRMCYIITVCDCEHWRVPASYFFLIESVGLLFSLGRIGRPFYFHLLSDRLTRWSPRKEFESKQKTKTKTKLLIFWALWPGAHYLAKGHHRPFTHVRRADEWMPTSNELFIIRFFLLLLLLCCRIDRSFLLFAMLLRECHCHSFSF